MPENGEDNVPQINWGDLHFNVIRGPNIGEGEGIRINQRWANPIDDFIPAPPPRFKKSNSENGPPLWNHILENVREIYGCDAAIAGGAIRDFFLGTPEKDIDVFVDIASSDVIISSSDELNFGPAMRTDRNGEYKARDPKIVGTWEFYHKGSVINLIAKPLPVEDYVQELLKTFDFEICKSAYYYNKEKGMYEIYDSPEAQCDRSDKTFTYVGPKDESELSFKRLERFNRRTGLNFRAKGIDTMGPILEAKKKADEAKRNLFKAMQGKQYVPF